MFAHLALKLKMALLMDNLGVIKNIIAKFD
jgi:hypothetical protein